MKKEELIVGKWYHGECRFIGDIGLWTGKMFIGITKKHGYYCDTSAVYGEDGFTPTHILPIGAGPEFSDGHNCEGFPGGCARLGCPGAVSQHLCTFNPTKTTE